MIELSTCSRGLVRSPRTVEDDVRSWMERHGLLSSPEDVSIYDRMLPGACGEWCYASCSRPTVVLGAKLIAWLFWWDNRHGESRDPTAVSDAAQSAIRALRAMDPRSWDDPLSRPMVSLAADVAILGEDSLERFQSDLASYFLGCLCESSYRRSRELPGWQEYQRFRRRSIGVHPCFDVFDMEIGYLPMYLGGKVERGRELAATLGFLINDLWSQDKERDEINTLVARGFLGDGGGSPELAACQHYRQLWYDLLELRSSCDGEDDRRYLDLLIDWSEGARRWTEESRRYREGEIKLHP